MRYGLVQSEQRNSQASLVKMEARYDDELRSLRAQLADVEERYQDLRRAPGSISDLDVGSSGDGGQVESQMEMASRLIALAEIVAERARDEEDAYDEESRGTSESFRSQWGPF